MRPSSLSLGLAVLALGCGTPTADIGAAAPPDAPELAGQPAAEAAETPLSTVVDPAIAAPRPVAPATGATVTSDRPTLTWLASPPVVGARVQICRDRACAVVEREIEVRGDHARPRRALDSGVHFWRVFGSAATAHGATPSAAIPFTVPNRATDVDTSWGAIPDVDGDGRADLALLVRAGVEVRPGSALGSEPTVVHTAAGATWLANAGDVDGDGFTDVVVGFPGDRADVLRGSLDGLGVAPPFTLTGAAGFASSGVALGDVDRDGYADLAIREGDHAVLYRGSSTGPVRGPMLAAASSLAPAGDVNGDGYADVLVALPGSVAILAGGAAGLSGLPLVTLGSPGGDVACAGDVNGDGYADVAIAASPSRVHVHLGAPSGPAATPSMTLDLPPYAGGGGPLLAAGGDVNGDGYDDLLVGTPGEAPLATRAALYFGSAAGVSSLAAQTFSLPALAFDPEGTFGASVGSLGDADGDGHADLVLGVAHVGTTRAAFVHAGTAAGAWGPPTFTLEAQPDDAVFARSFARAF